MALVNVTCTRVFPDPNHVGMRLIVTDDDRPDLGSGEQVVINATIKRQFESGNNLDLKMRDSIKDEAQKLIDDYKVLRDLYNDSAYINGATFIEGALTL
jgi:hypothetical protein